MSPAKPCWRINPERAHRPKRGAASNSATACTVKRLPLLTQLLLDLPTGSTLLPLGSGHVMARQSPEPSRAKRGHRPHRGP